MKAQTQNFGASCRSINLSVALRLVLAGITLAIIFPATGSAQGLLNRIRQRRAVLRPQTRGPRPSPTPSRVAPTPTKPMTYGGLSNQPLSSSRYLPQAATQQFSPSRQQYAPQQYQRMPSQGPVQTQLFQQNPASQGSAQRQGFAQQMRPADQAVDQRTNGIQYQTQIVVDPRTNRAYVLRQPRQQMRSPQASSQPNTTQPNTIQPGFAPGQNVASIPQPGARQATQVAPQVPSPGAPGAPNAPRVRTPNVQQNSSMTASTKPEPQPVPALQPAPPQPTQDFSDYGSSILSGPESDPSPASEIASQQESAGAPKRTPVLGIEIQERNGQRGVTVVSVTPNSPAAKAGLNEGDRIVSVEGNLVTGVKTLVDKVAGQSIGDSIRIQLVRGERLVSSNVTLEAFDDGSKSAQPNAPAPSNIAAKKPSPPIDSPIETKSPAVQESKVMQASATVDSKESPAVKQADDSLDFNDDEPISSTIFDSSPIDASASERTLQSDR